METILCARNGHLRATSRPSRTNSRNLSHLKSPFIVSPYPLTRPHPDFGELFAAYTKVTFAGCIQLAIAAREFLCPHSRTTLFTSCRSAGLGISSRL